jgi:hypothetical protein
MCYSRFNSHVPLIFTSGHLQRALPRPATLRDDVCAAAHAPRPWIVYLIISSMMVWLVGVTINAAPATVCWASKSPSPRGVIPSFGKGSRVFGLTRAGYPGWVLTSARIETRQGLFRSD